MRFADVEYKVKISQASSNNPVKAVVSKVASRFEHDNYKRDTQGYKRKGEILALMGPSRQWENNLEQDIGRKIARKCRGTVTYNDIPYNTLSIGGILPIHQ
ncbi:hypothetical protein RND71_015920 [Anisodus tanguticus]|uniref:Uncharacterized protein n=1 Tax=Anisodus tanguticus TaxID=243964 RepID=A0AAE1S806_9SOLA|nr:hypothetical protein RND71_015920 [Anisodus tanguticus]